MPTAVSGEARHARDPGSRGFVVAVAEYLSLAAYLGPSRSDDRSLAPRTSSRRTRASRGGDRNRSDESDLQSVGSAPGRWLPGDGQANERVPLSPRRFRGHCRATDTGRDELVHAASAASAMRPGLSSVHGSRLTARKDRPLTGWACAARSGYSPQPTAGHLSASPTPSPCGVEGRNKVAQTTYRSFLQC